MDAEKEHADSEELLPTARDARFWQGRQVEIGRISAEALQQPSDPEKICALLSSDLFADLTAISENLEQVLQRTTDPLDRLNLSLKAMAEISKGTRDLRGLSNDLARIRSARNE